MARVNYKPRILPVRQERIDVDEFDACNDWRVCIDFASFGPIHFVPAWQDTGTTYIRLANAASLKKV